MNTRLWVVLAVLVVATVGGLLWYKSDDSSYIDHLDGDRLITKQNIIDAMKKSGQEDIDESTIIPDHFLGKKDSKVIVIEYEDLTCSACQSLSTYANKIHEDYEGRVLFIYRHFRLPDHPNSVLSSSATEAAYLIGGKTEDDRQAAFWQMHELIFQDQTCTGAADKNTCKETILDYADQIGLDVDKFKTALADFTTNGINSKINRDTALGRRAGVNSTPTWIINGEKIVGARDSEMREAIEQALKDTK
jgi:protein-disulfide isomerase